MHSLTFNSANGEFEIGEQRELTSADLSLSDFATSLPVLAGHWNTIASNKTSNLESNATSLLVLARHQKKVASSWPKDLLACVKRATVFECKRPARSNFRFELTAQAAEHNIKVLELCQFNLARAIERDGHSPLEPGSEFRPSNIIEPIFRHHPLWNRFL